MPNDLGSFISKNEKFLKLEDEETATLIYSGYVVGADPRDPSKEKVTYKFKRPDGSGPVFLNSASVSLARRFMKMTEGTTIQLTRHGLGTSTTYEINEA